MSLVINTNVSSLFAQQYLAENQQNLSSTLQRLSSGLRINNASDDPAGLAISQTMQTTISGLNQGSSNGQNGVNLVQTAQGAMSAILNDLQLMSQLATEAASGTNSSTNLTDLNAQYQGLLSDITRVTTVTNFNGVNVLGGGSIAIQIGTNASASSQISITLTSTATSSLGIASTDLTSNADALTALTALNTAIGTVTSGLATLGADSSNLQAAIQSNQTYATNLSAAKSSILDADYAAESSNLAKYNVLNQADAAMLAQANSVPQLVLQLLRQ